MNADRSGSPGASDRRRRALIDPTSVYAAPIDVCRDSGLRRDDKIEILRRWKYDALELQVAEEESMVGDSKDLLSQILAALRSLGAPRAPSGPVTKHGD